ncbi:MAG: transglycosylase family protein [Dehalococcoidia bacterium]
MRRQILDAVNPFLRGARLGATVTVATLVVSLAGAVVVLATQPGPQLDAYVAADAPALPPERAVKVEVEIDQVLLQEARRWRSDHATPLALSREPGAPAAAEDQPPAAAAQTPTLAPPAPVVTAAAPLVVPEGALRDAIEAHFPEQVEVAYAIIMCESHGNARAVSPHGYYGLWQFDLATWASVGGAGLPSEASVEEQMTRARVLYDARGWSPWGCA